MSKLITSKPVLSEDGWKTSRKISYTTHLNVDLINNMANEIDYDSMAAVLVEDFSKIIRSAIPHMKQHPDKQIIVNSDMNVTRTPVVQSGGIGLSFSMDEEIIITIRGKEKCDE